MMAEETTSTPSPKTPSHFDLLSTSWPFSSLPTIVVDLLAHHMEDRPFRAGETLIRQGDPGDSLIVIVEGSTEVTVRDEQGGRLLLARPGRGEVLGEMALLTNEPRNADVVATTDGMALVLPVEAFLRLAARHPIVSVVLTDLAARRLGGSEFDALHGKVLDAYRVTRCLGRGGMAMVYEAEALEDGKRVALKMMNHRLVYEPQTFQRFQREADIVASLRHENIAALYGRFSAYNTYFLVMEFCDGPTLGQIIDLGDPIPEDPVRKIVGQMANALEHVHRHGVIHRDIKPANVMLTREGVVKLMDFGIAKPESPSNLTQKGLVLGTPRYMPPEQLAGNPVDHRADVYALGCMVYALVTGKQLFEGGDLAQVLYQKLTWKMPSANVIRPNLSADLYDVLKRTITVEPAERTIDLHALTAWAGKVDTARLFPFDRAPGFETTPTKTAVGVIPDTEP
jgi:tRNA A-37 threonylcarbamoyl transferase component Bud32